MSASKRWEKKSRAAREESLDELLEAATHREKVILVSWLEGWKPRSLLTNRKWFTENIFKSMAREAAIEDKWQRNFKPEKTTADWVNEFKQRAERELA